MNYPECIYLRPKREYQCTVPDAIVDVMQRLEAIRIARESVLKARQDVKRVKVDTGYPKACEQR